MARGIWTLLLLGASFVVGWSTCKWTRNNRLYDGLWSLRFTADDMLDAAWMVETGGPMDDMETKNVARTLRTYSRWIREAINEEPTP